MSDFYQIVSDYFKGKSIYPVSRRFFNLLFNVSISSFIYEKIYGSYYLLNFSEYNKIFTFLIKGQFFIPLTIFLIVATLTYIIGTITIASLTHFQNIKITTHIATMSVEPYEINKGLKQLAILSKFSGPMQLSKAMIIDLYLAHRHEISIDAIRQISATCNDAKENLSKNIILIIRGLIAITIYFSILPQFSLWLFLTLFIISIGLIYFFCKSFLVVDNLPLLVQKVYEAAEKYIDTEHVKSTLNPDHINQVTNKSTSTS